MKKLILSLALVAVLHTLPCGAMDPDNEEGVDRRASVAASRSSTSEWLIGNIWGLGQSISETIQRRLPFFSPSLSIEDAVPRLKTDTMDSDDIRRLIQTLSQLGDRMEAIVVAVEGLKNPTMSDCDEIVPLIEVLVRIQPVARMEAIAVAVALLKNPSMIGPEIRYLISTLVKISPMGRMEAIVAAVVRLKNTTMDGYEISELIRALAATPEGRMEGIVAAVMGLTPTMNGHALSELIRALTATPEHRMTSIVDGAQALIRHGMDGHDSEQILGGLRNLNFSGDATVARAHRVAARLNEITQAHRHGLTSSQMREAILTLLPNPEAPF